MSKESELVLRILKTSAVEVHLDQAKKVLSSERAELKQELQEILPSDGTQSFDAGPVKGQIRRGKESTVTDSEAVKTDLIVALKTGEIKADELLTLLASDVLIVGNNEEVASMLVHALGTDPKKYTKLQPAGPDQLHLIDLIKGGKAWVGAKLWKNFSLADQIKEILGKKLNHQQVKCILEADQSKVKIK